MPKMAFNTSFNPEVKEALESFLLEDVEVEPGKAFGMPAYYINGKMFAGVWGDGATLKVPADQAAELLARDGISEFEPMAGRVMRNWVLITRGDPADLRKDKDLFDTAIEYVRELSLKAPAARPAKRRPAAAGKASKPAAKKKSGNAPSAKPAARKKPKAG
jgi:hypothetical protein